MYGHLLELVLGKVEHAVLECTVGGGLENVDDVRALVPLLAGSNRSRCDLALHKQIPLPDSITKENKTDPAAPAINTHAENEFDCRARRGMHQRLGHEGQ